MHPASIEILQVVKKHPTSPGLFIFQNLPGFSQSLLKKRLAELVSDKYLLVSKDFQLLLKRPVYLYTITRSGLNELERELNAKNNENKNGF